MDANKMPQNLAQACSPCSACTAKRSPHTATFTSRHELLCVPTARRMKMPSDFSVPSTSPSQDKRPLTIAEVIPCALVTGP